LFQHLVLKNKVSKPAYCKLQGAGFMEEILDVTGVWAALFDKKSPEGWLPGKG